MLCPRYTPGTDLGVDYTTGSKQKPLSFNLLELTFEQEKMPVNSENNEICTMWGIAVCYQFSSVAPWCPALCDPMDCSTPGFPVHINSRIFFKFMSIKLMMPSNHFIHCHPLLLPSSIFASIRVFSSEPILHIRWPKNWSFSFSISPSNKYSAWFPLGLTGWISSKSKRPSRVFSNTTVQKHQFFDAQLSL